MAGTGKSTIARTISQELADKNKLGASFFFKRGEGDRGRAAFFFPTIAAQIARQLPSLAPFVRNEVEADPSINHKALNDQFDSLIVKPIQQLPRPSQRQTLAIVVDALDECDHLDDVKRIIHLLSQVKSFSRISLKAFVTSRPELPIQLGFHDIAGEYTDLVLQEIPKPIIKNDMTVFLEHELANIRLDYNKARPNRPLPPSWPEPEQIQRLVEMAVPLFIFAATVCRFIKDRRLGGPRDQLERILERQGDRKSKLDATYLPVTDRLLAGLNESQIKEVVGRFKKLLALLLSSIALYHHVRSLSSWISR
uniref:Nephrocystin 3-like N-terminal domain-containing protein n=1 Tax=Bionectria ochroleuca TaxID=29856 RepID=A0A8H7N3N1_BIOOC